MTCTHELVAILHWYISLNQSLRLVDISKPDFYCEKVVSRHLIYPLLRGPITNPTLFYINVSLWNIEHINIVKYQFH